MKKFKFDELLTGKRIYLKKHSVDLASTMFNYVEEDRERLDEFLPWVKHTKTLEDEIGYIKHTHESWDNFTLFDYGIFNVQDDVYMGNIGAHTINWLNDVSEIGYWILGKFEGQGFMSEAVQILEQYLFEVGFNRVEIRCSSINIKSASVPLNNGYVLDGELRQDAIEKGQYRDTKIFSKLCSEYIKSNKEIFVRRARHLDAKGIISSHIKSIKEVCSPNYNQKQISAWSGRDFQESIWCESIDNHYVWVLDNGDKILGFGHLMFHDDTHAKIRGLYFSPDALKQGLGLKLISKMKDVIKNSKIERVTLSSTITAKGFYEKVGFKTKEERMMTIGGEQVECYSMEMRV